MGWKTFSAKIHQKKLVKYLEINLSHIILCLSTQS